MGAPRELRETLFGGRTQATTRHSFDCAAEEARRRLRHSPARVTLGVFPHAHPQNAALLQLAWTFKARNPLSAFLFRSRSACNAARLPLAARRRLSFCDFDVFLHNALVLGEGAEEPAARLAALQGGDPAVLPRLSALLSADSPPERQRSTVFSSQPRKSALRPSAAGRRATRALVGDKCGGWR